MRSTVLGFHAGLGFSRRLSIFAQAGPRVSAAELGMLVLLGICAALLSTVVKLNLGLPGHNIIRVIFPMALGLAVVPRIGAASVMGLSGTAVAAALALGRTGVGVNIGVGAITSLALTGLLVDLALLGAKNGWSIYVRLTLAGLAANIVAMLVRGGSKLLSGGQVDGLPIEFWLPKAALTYPICGILAGLISAIVWFRMTARQQPFADRETIK
jgi:hypothetical protein